VTDKLDTPNNNNLVREISIYFYNLNVKVKGLVYSNMVYIHTRLYEFRGEGKGKGGIEDGGVVFLEVMVGGVGVEG